MVASGSLLILGPVVFQGFELPQQVALGGSQRLAVHRLADGSRVVDVLGPDADDIAWSGVLTGPLAAARARSLDDLRLSGNRLALTFGSWSTTVIVSHFVAGANLSGWIPYRITCTVVTDALAVDPILLAIETLAFPGDPGPNAGLDSPDLTLALTAAATLAQAAAVRSLT